MKIWKMSLGSQPNFSNVTFQYMLENSLIAIHHKPTSHQGNAFINIANCRVSTGWMSYNYLKSQYLLEGCKSEILEFLQPD